MVLAWARLGLHFSTRLNQSQQDGQLLSSIKPPTLVVSAFVTVPHSFFRIRLPAQLQLGLAGVTMGMSGLLPAQQSNSVPIQSGLVPADQEQDSTRTPP